MQHAQHKENDFLAAGCVRIGREEKRRKQKKKERKRQPKLCSTKEIEREMELGTNTHGKSNEGATSQQDTWHKTKQSSKPGGRKLRSKL